MRRNEVIGLKWPDVDLDKRRLCVNRGLLSVGYEVHQTRGKTKTSRRTIDLDGTTMAVLTGWRAFQAVEVSAVGIDHDEEWSSPTETATRSTPTRCPKRSSASSTTPVSR
jgi:integrase